MNLAGKSIGFAITGSHCTYSEVRPVIQQLVEMGVDVTGIVSSTVQTTNTRFAEAENWVAEIESITGHPVIKTIVEAEPTGPSKKFDAVVIAPCTGNTLSRFANAMTDSPVLMVAKATIRNDRPVIIAISTNDGLGLNMSNLAKLMSAKNIFMVPFGQDDPVGKMNSLVARMNMIVPTIELALEKKQIQPVLVEKFRDKAN